MKPSAENKDALERPTRLLTIRGVASRLQVSEKSVRRWIGAGDLPVYRLGDCVRIAESDLAEFLKRRRMP